MHKLIGHMPLMCTACGVIIENGKGEVLLQQRTDNEYWGLPGGCMEIGETFFQTAKREVFEETGLVVDDLTLFGVFPGKDRMITYPNGDVCCVTSIIFKTRKFFGEIIKQNDESKDICFFNKDCLPNNANEFDKKYLNHWQNINDEIIVD